MAKQKKLAYNKKYGKVVRQLDGGEFLLGGTPGYGNTGSFGGGGGIDPFGGYLTQEIDTMSADPSGQGTGIGALSQRGFLPTFVNQPVNLNATQGLYNPDDPNTSRYLLSEGALQSLADYEDAVSNQRRRTTEFASGFVNPQAALSRQEYYNQQAQQGPKKDWSTYPKESDYDTNGDGQMSKDERKRLDEARAEWQKNPPLRDDAGATDTSSFQGQPLPGTEEPVQEPGEDKDSFLQRLLDWLLRSGGGQRPGVGIQIPFPGFPGGGGGGFPFPFPRPGGGGTSGGGTTPPSTPTPPSSPPTGGGGTQPPSSPGSGGGTTQPPSTGGGGGGTTQPPVEPTPPTQPPVGGGGGEPGPIDDSRQDEDDGTIVIVPDWPEGSGGSGSGGNTGGGTSTGGTNVSQSDDLKALQRAASQGAIKVYQDPNTFDRFAPSPLQTMDPRYRNISSFLPSGEITPYAMNYQRTPGAIYANYPDAPRTQGGPLTAYAPRPTTGGSTTQPGTTQPGTTQPGTTQPGTRPPADDNYEDNLREIYERQNPYPTAQSTAGVNTARARIIERENEAAIEEWEKGFDEFKAQVDSARSRMGLGSIYLGDSIGFAQGGIAAYADGGNVDYFPRKNGQIEGPGTETSDDIPAMLSDGEFVVNAKAVRGIGALQGANGDREDQRLKGARAMYALQRMGEKAAGMRS